jgi:hypothetical protein
MTARIITNQEDVSVTYSNPGILRLEKLVTCSVYLKWQHFAIVQNVKEYFLLKYKYALLFVKW